TFAAAGNTITRATGSWLDEGFASGQVITVRGTAANDGTYTITAATAGTLTVTGRALGNETAQDGVEVSARAARFHGDDGLTFTNVDTLNDQIHRSTGSWVGPIVTGTPALSFSSDFVGGGFHGTIRRSGGSWLDDGFQAGQTIRVEGTNVHDGVYRIGAITDN